MTGILVATLSSALWAQGHRGSVIVRPRVSTVIVGGSLYSPYYSPFYSPFGWGYPYNSGVQARPSKLDQTVADIEHDYAERISSARTALSGKEKRMEIKRLKEARDAEIDLAKRNYYKDRNA